MRVTGLARCVLLVIPAIAACAPTGSGAQRELVIFHAGSLSVPLRDASEAFESLHPEIEVALESAGSLDAARKITDLGRECDLFASADIETISNLLIPNYASWYLVFATNEIGLAYRPALPPDALPTSGNWTGLLRDPKLKFGRSDPDADPAGYRTLLMFELAEAFFDEPGLEAALTSKDERFVRPKSADLIAMLQTGAIDYALVYKSVARQHGIPFLELPDEINLSAPEYAARYATASVEIAGKAPGRTTLITGQPILYALTIPSNAPNSGLAVEFLEYFLSAGGLGFLELNHQSPLVPSPTPYYDALPEALKRFARPTSP